MKMTCEGKVCVEEERAEALTSNNRRERTFSQSPKWSLRERDWHNLSHCNMVTKEKRISKSNQI